MLDEVLHRALPLRPHRVVQEILIAESDAVFKLGFVSPAEIGGFAYIQKLARGTVRTGGVPFDFALITDNFRNKFC